MAKFRHRNKQRRQTATSNSSKRRIALKILKEDIEAFVLLIEKAISNEEVSQNPITALLLSLANLRGSLNDNKTNKATRN